MSGASSRCDETGVALLEKQKHHSRQRRKTIGGQFGMLEKRGETFQ